MDTSEPDTLSVLVSPIAQCAKHGLASRRKTASDNAINDHPTSAPLCVPIPYKPQCAEVQTHCCDSRHQTIVATIGQRAKRERPGPGWQTRQFDRTGFRPGPPSASCSTAGCAASLRESHHTRRHTDVDENMTRHHPYKAASENEGTARVSNRRTAQGRAKGGQGQGQGNRRGGRGKQSAGGRRGGRKGGRPLKSAPRKKLTAEELDAELARYMIRDEKRGAALLDAELDASATSSSTDEEDADDAGAASGAESESGAALAAARSVPMLENFLPRPLPM